jgi:cytoskeletal protein RodZ
MDDLGARLRRAREARGVSLQDIAARTKISAVALEALERNDLSRLPGGIFGRAFVRAYASEIGLNPDATVAEFQSHLEDTERAAAEREAAHPEVTPDDQEFLARQRGAVFWLRVALSVVGVALVGLVVWQARSLLTPADPAPPRVAQAVADPPPPPR